MNFRSSKSKIGGVKVLDVFVELLLILCLDRFLFTIIFIFKGIHLFVLRPRLFTIIFIFKGIHLFVLGCLLIKFNSSCRITFLEKVNQKNRDGSHSRQLKRLINFSGLFLLSLYNIFYVIGS